MSFCSHHVKVYPSDTIDRSKTDTQTSTVSSESTMILMYSFLVNGKKEEYLENTMRLKRAFKHREA